MVGPTLQAMRLASVYGPGSMAARRGSIVEVCFFGRTKSNRKNIYHGLDNELFRPGVDGAGRFVKNQDLGVLQQGPGNGDSLTLTAGEGRAPFADDRVVAFGQRHDELVGIGGACGRLDVSAGGARAT